MKGIAIGVNEKNIYVVYKLNPKLISKYKLSHLIVMYLVFFISCVKLYVVTLNINRSI